MAKPVPSDLDGDSVMQDHRAHDIGPDHLLLVSAQVGCTLVSSWCIWRVELPLFEASTITYVGR